MTNRRMDAVYFVLLIAVAGAAYAVSRFSPEEEFEKVDLSAFQPPELELEVPFEFPYDVVKFKKRKAPTLVLSDDMESVLGQVRAALLESSTDVEVRPVEALAANLD